MGLVLTSLNYLSNLVNIGEIKVPANNLTELIIDGCPQLTVLQAYDNNLFTLDLSYNQELIEVSIGNNPNLTTIYVPNFEACTYFNITNCSILSPSTIDDILVKLSNQGIFTGYAFLNLGNNAIPTSVGIDAADYLFNDLDWNVTYNT
jgi:hypothetical protein